MVVGTCTGKCEGKIKLTAGWLDDEVCRCTGRSSSSSGTAGEWLLVIRTGTGSRKA